MESNVLTSASHSESPIRLDSRSQTMMLYLTATSSPLVAIPGKRPETEWAPRARDSQGKRGQNAPCPERQIRDTSYMLSSHRYSVPSIGSFPTFGPETPPRRSTSTQNKKNALIVARASLPASFRVGRSEDRIDSGLYRARASTFGFRISARFEGHSIVVRTIRVKRPNS